MKKLFILSAIFMLVLMASCSDDYDDAKLWESVNSLEQRMSAMETVMNAYKNGLTIKSVDKTDEGYVIVFSDGTRAVIKNGRDGKDGVDGQDGADGKDGKDGLDGKDGVDGKDGADGKDGQDGHDGRDGKDGADGDTLIDHIVVGENEVSFYLTDGTSFAMPLYNKLVMTFAEEDLRPVNPNETRNIHFTLETIIPEVDVEVITSADVKAKIVRSGNTSLEGMVEVKTGDVVDEYTKVLVLASNGEKTIMRGLHFENAGLKEYDGTSREVAAEGGMLVLDFLSNVPCTAEVSEDGADWITPETRALTKQQLTFNVLANKDKKRTAHITVKAEESDLKIVFEVTQKSGAAAKPIEMETGGFNFGSEAVFAMRCNTHNATMVSYKGYVKEELDNILNSQSLSAKDYILNNKETFTKLNEYDLETLNDAKETNKQGLWIPIAAEPGKKYSMLYYVEEDYGGIVAERIDTEVYPLTLFGWVGDKDNKRTFDRCIFNVLCGEKIKKARYFTGNLDDYDFYETLAPGMGMDNMGRTMTAEQIKEINTREGLFIEIYSKPQSWTGTVVEITFEDGTQKVVRDKVMLDALASNEGGPKLDITSKMGDADGNNKANNITFTLTSPDKKVAGAFYNMLTTEELEMQVDWYFMSLYEVAITNSTLIYDIDAINGQGNTITTKGLYPDTPYSLVVITWDEAGNYTESRYDITTEADKSKSDNINIADQNFKNYLVNHFDKDGDFEISIKEAMAINEIYADCKDIESLEGIEKLTHLQVLDVSFNHLTSIDLSHNYEITKVICGNNQISDADFTQNTEMQYLDCSYNKLTSLDIFNCTNIKELNCSFNAIGDLQISNNMFIENLYCRNCGLTSLGLTTNYQIRELDCSENSISTLDVSGLKKMVKLNCSNNQISELKTGKMYDLLSLKCEHNNIASLNVKNNYQLELLYCGANKLSELDLEYGSSIKKLNSLDNPDLKTIWVWAGFNADDYNYKVDSWTEFKEKK